jgi:O-acetylhomoserine (thiol)-lyase
MKFETLAVHAGYSPDPVTRSVAVPIYQTVSYAFDDTQHGADLFDLKVAGNIYTRMMNPTNDVLEKRVAALEGGVAALAVASGMAAITAAIQTLAEAGDNIVSSSRLYGGTYNLFAHTFPRQGLEVRFADPRDPDAFARLIDARTRAVFCETIGNPLGNVTKYLGGHGNSMGGAIVDSGKFDWAAHADRFKLLVEPDVSYHGVSYTAQFGAAAFIARARVVPLRNMGAALSPLNAFLILQGIETLPLRMDRICANALHIAAYLQKHPRVAWVRYAGLVDHPDHDVAQRLMQGRASGILSFGLKGGREAGARFQDALKLFTRLVNIGDCKSLACHPATTTHRQLNAQELAAAGVSEDMVRLSIGIENQQDLIADLDQALEASGH